MFQVGEVVLYPLYGVGTISEIKEMEVLGSVSKYYSLKVSTTGMSVMIPVEASNVGLRKIVDKKTANAVIDGFAEIQCEECQNWNKRYRENMVLLKTGNIDDTAQVVKSLMLRDIERGLSTGERRMFVQAKQILFSEISAATGIQATELELRLYKALAKS